MRYSVDHNLCVWPIPVKSLALLIAVFFSFPVFADDTINPAQPAPASNDDAGAKFSGFFSLIGGKVLGGSYYGTLGAEQFQCPCYVADWANGGVYRPHWQIEPETHGGIQMDYTFNKTLSATVQVVSRGPEITPNFQYAFVDYKIDGNWDVHLGRERLPLFYYSDFQDIGVAFPWVSVPPEVYGWEVTNYNGVSLRYKGVVDGVSANGELYTGSDHEHNAAEISLTSYPLQEGDAYWRDLIGTGVELSKDFWTFHANFMTGINTWDGYSGNNLATQRIKIESVALNLDFETWFIVSEAGQFERNNYLYGYTERTPSWTFGVGYRYGPWTPLLNYARYLDHYSYQTPQEPIPQFPNGGGGATLRYDIDARSDIKIQFDKYQDYSVNAQYSGNVRVFRASYDISF